jgi:two-component system OmpR family response regulator
VRVLVVEDDAKLRMLLQRGLEQQGFSVDAAADGTDGLWRAREFAYDAMVLDVMLPDTDGFSLCRELRRGDNWVPVLMLTALDDVSDRVRGLDVGADDYLAKPFEFTELGARLRALLRRGASPRPTALTVGDLLLDPASRDVRRGETPIRLTAREFSLLEYLMRHPDQALTRTELVQHVWDAAYDGDLHVVNVYVSYLRDKIDRPFGRRSVRTVRGSGYLVHDDLAR